MLGSDIHDSDGSWVQDPRLPRDYKHIQVVNYKKTSKALDQQYGVVIDNYKIS